MKTREKIKYAIKVFLAYFLFYTGILHLYKRVRLKNKAVVLMYHRILSKTEKENSFSHDGIIVETEIFKKHVIFLQKTFNILTLSEFTDRFKNLTPFANSSCLITFDDGWLDNYSNAFPVLKEYKLPAVIFLPVDFIGSQKLFWRERLSGKLYAAYRMKGENIIKVLKKINLGHLVNLSDSECRKAIMDFATANKGKSMHEIEGIISELSNLTNSQKFNPNNIDAFVNWEQVQKMARNRIDFGAHGVHHKILPSIPLDEASEEIGDCMKELTKYLDSGVDAFCYPNGDYNLDIIDIVKSKGYQFAFTTENGHVSCHDDPLTIRRINIHNDVTKNIPLFFSRVLGLL